MCLEYETVYQAAVSTAANTYEQYLQTENALVECTGVPISPERGGISFACKVVQLLAALKRRQRVFETTRLRMTRKGSGWRG